MTTTPPGPPSGPTAAPARPGATAPSAGRAFGLLYRTFLRSGRTTGRLVCLAVLSGLAVALAFANASSDRPPSLDDALQIAAVGTSSLVGIAALVVASAILGDLYDNGSIVYVVLRPVRRWVVASAAWAAAVTLVLPAALVIGLSIGIVHGGDGLVAASVIGALLSALSYAAVFGLLGVLVKRSLPAGLAFVVVWEGFISNAGTMGARLTVSGYVRSILARITDGTIESAPFSLASSVVTLLAVPVVLVAVTGWLIGRRELP